MKQTFRKLLITMLVLCTFVGVLPLLAAEDFTAQAAAADVYYDFKKANDGSNLSADYATKRTAFEALTYDEVAARNTSITSGSWAYHSFSATAASDAGDSDATNFTSNSYAYYNYDKTKGLFLFTGARQGTLKAAVKFKGMNAGSYVPFLNINGAYLRTYSGLLTANIYKVGSTSPIVTKEICLSDYPEDDSYVQLSNAVAFEEAEYYLELVIDKERTLAIVNGLDLQAADTATFCDIYPTNDLGVYKVVAGSSTKVYFTQLMSDGTTSTTKFSGWASPTYNDTTTTTNDYVSASVSSGSQYVTINGLAATSTPQTIYINNINGIKTNMKINVIVLSAAETQSDLLYNFFKARPSNWTSHHYHNFGAHIKYNHTAVGGYGEINTSLSSEPWKVVSVADTAGFSPLYSNYGIEHMGTGVTDLKIQVPVAGVYVPQLQVATAYGLANDVTVTLLTTGGSTVCSTTVAAGTTTEYVSLSTSAVSLSATEYIVRFSKSSAGKNYYNGIKLLKSNTTTVTLDPNGGTVGTKTSVTASYGLPMPGIDAEGYLPTRTGYRFGGFFENADATGTQYYTMAGKSNHVWDQTSSTATIYAFWNVNTYTVNYNANGGSGTTASSSHTYDTAKNLTANGFSRDGYTFLGWSTSSTATSATYTDKASVKNLVTTNGGSITLYAVWKANTYTVAYNANGGDGSMSNSSHTYGTAKALTANAFTKTGYTFQGWDTSSAGTTVVYTDEKSVSNLTSTNGGTVNLYAVWKANTYTITFESQGGSGGTASISVSYGAAMPSITPPTKTGFTFTGYYATSSGGTKYYNADGTSAKNWDKAEDAILYGRWSRNTYAVTLDANGGTEGTTSVTASYNLAMPAIETLPTRSGYIFEGYYDATSGGTQYYNADGTSARTWNKASAATLYARWTNGVVTLNSIGAKSVSAGSELTFTASATTTAPDTTITYSATGLPSGASINESTGAFSWTPTVAQIGSHTITIKASDSVNSANQAVTVTVEAPTSTVTLNTGSGTSTVTATYGSAMPAITVPTKIGYIFSGYYTGENGSGTQYYKADGSSAKNWDKTGNVTLYANWIQGEVTITPIEDKTVAVEEELTFTVEATSTAGDITYTAENLPEGATFNEATGEFSWTPTTDQVGEYTIIFKGSDGVNYAEVTVNVVVDEIKTAVSFDEGQDSDVIATYGAALPTITAPEKEGYIFGGYFDADGVKYYNADGTSARSWDKKDETVTLYAKWTAGDERLGTRVAVLRDITYKDDDGNTKFKLYLLAGIDNLAYKAVGFEVTIDGVTVTQSTQFVYQQISDNKNTYLPNAFGDLCQYGFAISFEFGKEFKDKTVTFRAFAKIDDEKTIYGKEATFEGIYTDLIEDDENGGDLVIDGEVEYA